MKSSEISAQTLYHMSNILNASYSTLHNLRTLKGVPMKCHPLSTSPSLMNIELSNFNASYNAEVTKQLWLIEDTPGTHGIIENLALIDPNDFEMKNKYLHRRQQPANTPTHFFLVGTVTNSSLQSGDISWNISVSFSNRTFPRAIAAVGDVLSEKVLFLPTFQQGISITTARRPSKGTGQATIRGLIPSSHHPHRHDEIEPGMTPYLYCPTKLINNLIFIFTALLPSDAKGLPFFYFLTP